MMPRFSLKWFLAFIGATCISVGALASENEWWNEALLTATVLLLCFGCTYIAVGGKRRGLWIGFVVFVFLNIIPMKVMPQLRIHPSESVAAALFAIVYPKSPDDEAPARQRPDGLGRPQSLRYYRSLAFRSHFDALTLLWLGALGGWVGQTLASTKDAR